MRTVSGSARVFGSPALLAEAFAAEMFASISGRPSFNIALSGGSTPRLLFETLAGHAAGLDWQRVHFYWGDERCVPPDDRDSNYRMAREALFDRIRVPAANIHRIRGEDDPYVEAERYGGEMLATLPGAEGALDLVMLGLGEDGHTASVFPHNIELIKSENLCEVSAHPESGQLRITVTGRVLAAASRIMFIATGTGKAQKVAEILGKKAGYELYPAGLVDAMRDDVQWWLDRDAASLLGAKTPY
jgi:6-phosphogluconolactonase